MFFRRCMCDGHVYWSAAAGWVQAELARLATLLHLPPCQADDSAWAFRDVISAALLGRLLGYEKLCRKVRRRAAFIVNLLQNAHWTNSLSDEVPSLLAGSSALWSMVAERLLLPIERLSVQGIGVFDHRLWHERYSIEQLALSQRISPSALQRLQGNGMHQAAIGSVLLFLCSSVELHAGAPAPCSPIAWPSAEGDGGGTAEPAAAATRVLKRPAMKRPASS